MNRETLLAKHSSALISLALEVLEGKAYIQWVCENNDQHFKTNDPRHNGMCPSCKKKMSVHVFR